MTLFKKVLSLIEPISLGPLALRGCLEKGKREVTKSSLLELIEFSTGLDPSTALHGGLKHIPTLKAQLGVLNAQMGRTARDFPAQRGLHGAYLFDCSDPSEPMLIHQSAGWKSKIPQTSGAIIDVSGLQTSHNYSESRAKLHFSDASLDFICCSSVSPDSGGHIGPLTPPFKKHKAAPASPINALASQSQGETEVAPFGTPARTLSFGSMGALDSQWVGATQVVPPGTALQEDSQFARDGDEPPPAPSIWMQDTRLEL